jgi:hypothetical protein
MLEQATAAAGACCMPYTSTLCTLCSVKQAAAREPCMCWLVCCWPHIYVPVGGLGSVSVDLHHTAFNTNHKMLL